ncbi:hypothetical protein [Pandoravirus japonicus]|uniref:Uncharacterized protein n=1 Tax=Pandoravirus japonicus TaxID=2823154 RepID=A0A811BM61_9VIRU|nr:hypothetical protein [Pandoravirus japonicus]
MAPTPETCSRKKKGHKGPRGPLVGGRKKGKTKTGTARPLRRRPGRAAGAPACGSDKKKKRWERDRGAHARVHPDRHH